MERGFCVEEKKKKMPNRKTIKIIIIIAAAVAVGICIVLLGSGKMSGEEAVKFEEINENKLPPDITSDVLPEYKTLERALACRVDDDVYVVVTRGEKPTSGFDVSVDRITLEEKDDKTNLIVYALFEDPDKETAISQIITYPVSVVRTDLKQLPDSIELRIEY